MSELVITNYRNSTICAVYENKVMVQAAAARKKDAHLGNIYVGRVDNIVKNINAAFVNITDNCSCYLDLTLAEGALFVKKQSEKKISIGDELIVQVIKEEVKTKAPVVSANFSLTGKYIVLVHHAEGVQISKKIQNKGLRGQIKEQIAEYLEPGYGIVVRTNAQYASTDELINEIRHLVGVYKEICSSGVHLAKYSLLYRELPQYLKQIRDLKEFSLEKIVTNIPAVYQDVCNYRKDYPVLDRNQQPVPVILMEDANELAVLYRINHYMDKALHKTVYLKSGATIVIEPTEALTVIDVNTGKAVSGKKATEDTFYQINIEAAKEIAAQIRLRNLSGIIIIDFINMNEKEKEEQLKEVLRSYLADDSVQTELVEITKLGLMELTRKKICKTLAEQLEEAQ